MYIPYKKSEVFFGQLANTLPYVRVTWNKEVVYDEDKKLCKNSLSEFLKQYEFKTILSMRIDVVKGNKFKLTVTGE